MESVGGVDAARRVAAGEHFDVVVLASDAIDTLIACRSPARRQPGRPGAFRGGGGGEAGAPCARPRLGRGGARGRAGRAHHRLLHRAQRRGADCSCSSAGALPTRCEPRLVQARAGVPVASLVASGEVALGFQQLSELLDVHGHPGGAGLCPTRFRSSPRFLPVLPSTCQRRVGAGRSVHALLASPDIAASGRRQTPPRHGARLNPFRQGLS